MSLNCGKETWMSKMPDQKCFLKKKNVHLSARHFFESDLGLVTLFEYGPTDVLTEREVSLPWLCHRQTFET